MNKFSIRTIDILLARKISKESMKKAYYIPYKEDDKFIYIAMYYEDKKIIDEMEFIFRKKAKVTILEKYYLEELIDKIYIGQKNNIEELIIKEAVNKKASDIHFEPNETSVIIRFRIDGMLNISYKILKEEYQVLLSKIKNLSNLDITEKRKSQDGKMTIKFMKIKYDLRIAIMPVFYGEKMVIRILYGTLFNFSIESLSLTEIQREKLYSIINVNNGLLIVNGPTGSGKSTTLYTILQSINTEDKNISTLEDPIEVLIAGVNQVNLDRSNNLNFADGIRSLMRQDPDVIMVGEIRDEETAKVAVRASLTGHKVLTTIHTKDPKEVYLRLEEMGIADYLIRDSLVGIISQRLIPLLCEQCKIYHEDIKINEKIFKSYNKCGCIYCNNTGYKGRGLVVAIHYIDRDTKKKLLNIKNNDELLTNDEMIHNLHEFLGKGQISMEDYNNFIQMEELKIHENIFYKND